VAITSHTYDGLNRLLSLTHVDPNYSTLAGYDFTYDDASRIASISSYVDGLTEYDYDDTNQLLGSDHTGQTDKTYDYDLNGNRTMSGYVVGANNRITSDGTYDYEYDDEGNMTAKETISSGAREEYTWDHRNRLITITFKNSGGTVTKQVDQTYDVFNRWIDRSIDPDGATGSATVQNTYFAYDGNQILFQFDGAAASDLTNRYLWGPDTDQLLAAEDVTSLSSAGNTLWPLGDHLGTLRDIADRNESTGAVTVTNHRRYEDYGSLVSETNAAIDLLFGYTGRPFDDSTNLQNNTTRWYMPELGEWMSDDWITFRAQDPNISRYVGNAPTRFVDPAGFQGHHPVPEKTWPETGLGEEAIEIWDDPKVRVNQPDGTGHNNTAHGAKQGYTAHVQALLRDELAAFISKNGDDCGKLTPQQQKQFAKEFLQKILSMPTDTYIGGFNDAVRRGGTAEVEIWHEKHGSKIKPPVIGKPVRIGGTLRVKAGPVLRGGGRIGGGAMSVINAVDTIESVHDDWIAAHTVGRKCEYQTYYFKDRSGHTFHYEQLGGSGIFYEGTDAVYDDGPNAGERWVVFWQWAKVRMLYKRFFDPPPPLPRPPFE
jgi:RHS repeat-associated protein